MNNHPKYKTILFNIQNNVAHIILNRPEAANAFNKDLFLEFFQAVLQCDGNPEVRSILISNTGKIFCAGGDLKAFATETNLSVHIKEMTIYLHGAISRLTRMDAPVIAAATGTAGGAGLSLLCACDIVYAAKSAYFTMAYTAAGLAPDGSSTYFLPRLVGHRRAMELTLTNRKLSAKEALDWGILTRIFPKETVLDKATQLATQLANGPTKAFGVTKRLLQTSWTESLETQMENEAQAIAAMAHTKDAQEGITAFIEKRPPNFKG